MKKFLILWLGPLTLLAVWYGLSYYDMNFGYTMLTRQTHDLVFEIYGNMLGLPPETIPPLVFKALILDTLFVIGILVFKRYRKQLWAYMRSWFGTSTKPAARLSEESDIANVDYSRMS